MKHNFFSSSILLFFNITGVLAQPVLTVPDKPIEVLINSKYALKNDFVIADLQTILTPYENTCKVTVGKPILLSQGSSQNDPGKSPKGAVQSYPGIIHLLSGERPGTLLGRSFTFHIKDEEVIFNLETPIKYKHSFTKFLNASDYAATDNHLVKLKDGSLLALKMGITQRDMIPKPAWWSIKTMSTEAGFSNPDGQRGATYILSSKNQGKDWSETGFLDAALIIKGPTPAKSFDGTFGYPRNDGEKFSSYIIGGSDRPELYYDPWKSRIYLTAWGSGGILNPSLVKNEDKKKLRKNIVETYTIFSDDLGKTWNVMDKFEGNAAVPLIMTSTEDGRFFEAYQYGRNGGIYIRYNTKADPNSLIMPPAAIDSSHNGKMLATDTMAFMTDKSWLPQISISRAGKSKIRIAYNALSSSGVQIIKTGIFEVLSDKPGDFIYTPSAIITASRPENSATYPMFIEPDIDLPNGYSNYAALYWTESSRSNAQTAAKKWEGNVKEEYAARYCVFDANNKIITRGFLSCSNGLLRYWHKVRKEGLGDYYTGGFFYAASRLNFVPQWTEDDGIHGNIISIPVTIKK